MVGQGHVRQDIKDLCLTALLNLFHTSGGLFLWSRSPELAWQFGFSLSFGTRRHGRKSEGRRLECFFLGGVFILVGYLFPHASFSGVTGHNSYWVGLLLWLLLSLGFGITILLIPKATDTTWEAFSWSYHSFWDLITSCPSFSSGLKWVLAFCCYWSLNASQTTLNSPFIKFSSV